MSKVSNKKPKPLLPIEPFNLGEVLDAAKCIMGTKVLLPAIEEELRVMADGYVARLKHLHNVQQSKSYYRRSDALWRVYSAPASKIVAFILANGVAKCKTMSWEELKAMACKVHICRPSGERVIAWQEPKSTEGVRWLCSFAPITRAAQCMVRHIIFMVAGPSPYEFAQKGHGRDAAARVTLHSIKHEGVRWFGLADVKDCFPSITREMVKKALPFLPMSIIEGTIFIHEETDIKDHYISEEHHQYSSQVIRTGIPQGSLVSPLVASKILQPYLDTVQASLVLVHVDNILIGGKTEEQVHAIVTALATSMKEHPDGSLWLTTEIRKLGDAELNYLGYRFRRRAKIYGGFGRAEASRRSFKRFEKRLALKLLWAKDSSDTEIIEKECHRFIFSFPAWEERKKAEYFAILHAELDVLPLVDRVRRIIKQEKIKWPDFKTMAKDLAECAQWVADCTPRLHSTGGPVWKGDGQDPGYGYAA